MKPEAPPEYYDKVFAGGRYERNRQFYYDWAVKTVVGFGMSSQKGLDIGCGPGGFLQTAVEAGLNIDGLDFSPEAVKQSRARTQGKCQIWLSTFEDFSQWDNYQYFTILETLEHVVNDLNLIRTLPTGVLIVGSVPSTNDPSHIRRFTGGVHQVLQRYSEVLDGMECKALSKTLFGFTGRVKPG